jgi:serine/threonine/tyrosine-interacting protein
VSRSTARSILHFRCYEVWSRLPFLCTQSITKRGFSKKHIFPPPIYQPLLHYRLTRFLIATFLPTILAAIRELARNVVEMVSAEDSASSHGGYVAASPWSERLNEPPRVPIPPPNLDFSQGQPSMIVKHSSSIDYDSDQFGNQAFLQALITNGSVTLTHKMLDWKYANRREAQMILPFLYIGPLSATKDEKFVRETGFTLLISVRNTASGPTRTMDAAKIAAPYGILSYNLDIDSSTDLIRKFPAAIKAINDHLEDSTNKNASHAHGPFDSVSIAGKVLVFCETGNERSAAFVAAYLIAVFDIDVITAIQTVQSQRFSMCMDDSTKNALGTFETLLSAKRDVERAKRHFTEENRKENSRPQNYQESAMPPRPKRTLDNVYNNDEGMEVHDGEVALGYERRMGEAPFHDKEG